MQNVLDTILLLGNALESINKLNREQLELNRVLTARILKLQERVSTCERWIEATESQRCETVSDCQSEGGYGEEI
jgi:hypothetical protein